MQLVPSPFLWVLGIMSALKQLKKKMHYLRPKKEDIEFEYFMLVGCFFLSILDNLHFYPFSPKIQWP